MVQNDDATKWKFYGATVDGTELAVIVHFKGGIAFVVTIHPLP